MDESFMGFLNDVPLESQEFVLELDTFLKEKGCRRTIKEAKSGFVTSYSLPGSGRTLLNYVFRKTGLKIRVYAQHVGKYSLILSDFPLSMKRDIIKAGDCKKLNGLNCTPTCSGGYSFEMDGVLYKKCKNMAFFHSMDTNNFTHIRKLIEPEIEYDE